MIWIELEALKVGLWKEGESGLPGEKLLIRARAHSNQ